MSDEVLLRRWCSVTKSSVSVVRDLETYDVSGVVSLMYNER